jgi:hypothetical protein
MDDRSTVTATIQTPELIGLISAAGTADRVSPLPCSKELYVGDVIQAAVVRFDSGRYLDIGTPEDIVAATGFVQAAEKEMTNDY